MHICNVSLRLYYKLRRIQTEKTIVWILPLSWNQIMDASTCQWYCWIELGALTRYRQWRPQPTCRPLGCSSSASEVPELKTIPEVTTNIIKIVDSHIRACVLRPFLLLLILPIYISQKTKWQMKKMEQDSVHSSLVCGVAEYIGLYASCCTLNIHLATSEYIWIHLQYTSCCICRMENNRLPMQCYLWCAAGRRTIDQ